jgi:hypothetical protein
VSGSPLKEWQTQLLTELSKCMPKYGFDKKAVGQAFYRKTPHGRDAFHVSFIRHTNDFDVTADVAVRIDALEDLVNADNRLLSKAEKRGTFSLGVELGNLSQGARQRWTIAAVEDVPPVAESILRMFENVGLPYLDRYSSLEGAFYALSSNDRDGWIHSPIHAARCKRAVGLAYLLGKQEDLNRLISDCESFLRDKKDVGLSSFQQFATSVR